jgi:hypothetical protein
MNEPIFSVLSGKTQQFPNGFTVSGFTGGYVVYNGDYNFLGGGAFPIATTGRDVFFWNGAAWQFSGYETGYEIEYVNSTGGGDSANVPTSGWNTPGGTLTFTAR